MIFCFGGHWYGPSGRWLLLFAGALAAFGFCGNSAAAPWRWRSPIISIARNDKEALNTAFRIAARSDSLEQLRDFIGKGAVIDSASEEGMTALMYAALHCHADSVNLLLEVGANMNLRDKQRRTALIYAARGGCLPVARLLLSQPGIKWRYRDKMKRNAYDYAKAAGELEVGGAAAAIVNLIEIKARESKTPHVERRAPLAGSR